MSFECIPHYSVYFRQDATLGVILMQKNIKAYCHLEQPMSFLFISVMEVLLI